MNLKELEIIFNEQKLVLNNQRALFWPSEKALIIADLHLGKAAYFRKNGIAIPTQVSKSDMSILAELIIHYHPEKLIIVGDFVHAQSNTEIDYFTAFRARFPLTQLILVKGNHDRLSDKKLQSLGVDNVVDRLEIKKILFVHESCQNDQLHSISGHIHPGIRFDLGKTKRSLSCFVVDDYRFILPAFSLFTGLNTRNNFSPKAVFYPFTMKEIFMHS